MRLSDTRFADLSRWTCLVVLVGSFLLAAPGVFAVDLLLIHDGEEEGKMTIGSDLDVNLSGGPQGIYTVRLVDEADEIVASTVLHLSQGQGSSVTRRLWTRTGVVGCDPGAVHDPDEYQFESFEEAETLLDERTFRVEVYQGILFPAAQSPVIEEEIAFEAPQLSVRAFPSDMTGCFRTTFDEGENLYLSIQHSKSNQQLFRNFLVHAQYLWTAGDSLSDVRANGSGVITVPSGNPSVHLLWSPAPGTGGDPPPEYLFDIILRPGVDSTPTFDPATDFSGGRARVPAGGTVPECKYHCVPP